MNWLSTRAQIVASLRTSSGRATVKQILRSKRERDTSQEALQWAQSLARPQGSVLALLDKALWTQAEAYAEQLAEEVRESWGGGITRLGGGGDIAVLYFLTRFTCPNTVVETGVAAGWSSRAILDALSVNGSGFLWSSDLPYVWSVGENFPVAPIVPKGLRSDWRLSMAGDRKSLPSLRGRVTQIDLFHYDSDKSYAGRAFALACLHPLFHDGTIVVMDDIQNNTFFKDFCEASRFTPIIFEYEGKYLGIVGMRLPSEI